MASPVAQIDYSMLSYSVSDAREMALCRDMFAEIEQFE
jgi:hypothetical protein